MNSALKKTVVVFYTPWLTHVIENLVFLILRNPLYKILILTKKDEEAPSGSEHPEAYARLVKTDNVEILPETAEARPSDYMVIRLNKSGFLWNRNLNEWVARCAQPGFLSDAYYLGESLKTRTAELVYNFPYWLTAGFGIFQTGSTVRLPYYNLKKKVCHIPYVHPQHLMNQELRELLFREIKIAEPRKFRMVFIGNQNPGARHQILKSVRKILGLYPEVIIHERVPEGTLDTAKIHVLWLVYGDNNDARGLAPAEYTKILQQSDFCLCPQGWDVWSHRVTECVLSGVVPILDHEWIYDMPMQDGINCMLTSARGWEQAVRLALFTSTGGCFAMRKAVKALASDYLSLSVMCDPLHQLFGLIEKRTEGRS